MITKSGVGKFGVGACAAVLALMLSGCGKEADRAARSEGTADVAARTSPASYTTSASSSLSTARREAQTPRFDDGKPLWAANRQRGGEENAEKQFERNGSDFGAASVDDYVKKAHAFLDSPPKGALTTVRSNGDVLYYDPKANVFLVADRQGAPRTMFKPRDGMAYWVQQKERIAQRDSNRDATGSRRRSRQAEGSESGNDESAG